MQLGYTINADDLPQGEGGDFKSLPAGWYTASISEASLNDTKSGTGQYIKLRYDITGPTHEGRVIFGNMNIRNANPKAESIGLQQLGDVMRALGLESVQDTDQLVGGSLQIKLKTVRDEQYGDDDGNKNEVVAWKAVSGSAPPAPKAEAASSTPPWLKK